jgi:uncharacterized protein YeaC (DUF1315 family)
MSEPGFQDLIEKMDEPTWRSLRRAVETGRWPDGRRLRPEQTELCMQAVIAWEQRHLPAEQRTGYVERNQCSSDEQPVTLQPGGRRHDA